MGIYSKRELKVLTILWSIAFVLGFTALGLIIWAAIKC